MLRRRLHSQLQLLKLPLCAISSSSVSASTAGQAAPAAAATATDAGVGAAQGLRHYAAEAQTDVTEGGNSAGVSSEVAQAAHELGLDAMPLAELREWMDPKRNKAAWDSEVITTGLNPKQRRLTYPDLPGFKGYMEALVSSPDTYKQHTPTAPAYDAAQWVEAHFKEAGYTMEPRGPFYVWRAWAATHLPQEQYETLLCVHEVMGDESTRSALVKQAQHELARLWDWQHRRAELGLPPDLHPTHPSPSAAAAAASAPGDAHSPAATAAVEAGAEGVQAAAAVGPVADDATAAAATAVADAAVADARAAVESHEAPRAASMAADRMAVPGASSDEEAAALSQLSDAESSAEEAEGYSSSDEAVFEVGDLADKGLLDVLEVSGALAESEVTAAAQGKDAAGAAAAADHEADSTTEADAALYDAADASVDAPAEAEATAVLASVPYTLQDVPYVADPLPTNKAKTEVMKRVMSSPQMRRAAMDAVRIKIEKGNRTDTKGRRIRDTGVPLRVYHPVSHDGDVFLPSRPIGNKDIAAAFEDPERTRPVNPAKVTEQAQWVVQQAQHAAASSRGNASAVEGLATWTDMPLLDRTVLHKETLRQAAEQLAAKPKAEKPWKLLQDGYAFDLQQRPPTTALDLLTSYLEIRYADVLLQKDAAQTLNRQLALHNLQSRGGLSTELLEQPPAALTAAKTLSAAEREAVCKTLDGLLGSRQFVQYRDAVLQLYGDGLISWGELQECWGAATAGEELAAAAEAPVSFAADRQQLFKVLAGQQQLPNDALRFGGNSSSSSSSSADSAAASAARRAWEEAGQQLQASWSSGRAPPPAATTAAAAAPSTAGTDAWWDNGPISYEEAEQTWQQLLHLAGQTDGPRFDQVLTAGSDGVQQQLQVLQRSLQRAVGLGEEHVQALTGLGSSTAAIGAADLQQQLQQVLAAPPSLEQLLQQHWEQVSQQELGRDLQQGQPTWSQLWRLLEQVASHQQLQAQEQQAAAVEAPLGGDASGEFERFLREADAVPLTPPPYPGARRLLRWEQRLMLHAVSGQVVLPAELKVKLAVSAAELQQETGLSDAALQYMLAVAGSRYNASTGDLTIACDRFPTREENRRWCLEVLHRLLQAAQAKFPSDRFWVDSNAVGVASSDLVAAGAQP